MEIDGLPLNLKVLDSIVLDYAEHEKLLSADTADQDSSAKRHEYETIDQIRSSLNKGLVEEAVSLIRASRASILEDQQLSFQLYKQQFLEHLRIGANDKAIQCARTSLEPLALNAYLEAYQDFKQVMLAFIFGPDDADSPVAEQWSLKKRTKLAGTLAGTLRASMGAYDPRFSLLLRYLISIQKRFLEMAGNVQPSPRLDRVLREVPFDEKDPPLVPNSSLERAPDFKEKDVQDVAHAVELPRQSAVDSLRVADANIHTALKNELSRMQVNRTIIDELAREYCVYRGLVACEPSSTTDAEPRATDPSPSQKHAENGPPHVKLDSTGVFRSRETVELGNIDASTPVESVNSDPSSSNKDLDPHIRSPSQSDFAALSRNGTLEVHPKEARRPNEQPSQVDEDGDVQMSDAQDGDIVIGALMETVAQETKPAKSIRTWQGRPEGFRELHDSALGFLLEISTTPQPPEGETDHPSIGSGPSNIDPGVTELSSAEHSQAERPSTSEPSTSGSADSEQTWQPSLRQASAQKYLQTSVLGTEVLRKYQRVLEIRDMASAGFTGQAVEATERLESGFFADKPELLFQLKEVEFVKLLDEGEYKQALRLARASLGPLAAQHRELLPALKATLLAFAKPGIHLPNSPPSPAVLATSLQEALADAIGVPEPLLVVLMRSLLDAHDEWFEMQMCEDPFRQFFKLEALKRSEADGDQTLDPSNEADEAPQTSGEQSATDESILTLMEFLAISRSDAIVLLDKFDGSVEAVFADKLGAD